MFDEFNFIISVFVTVSSAAQQFDMTLITSTYKIGLEVFMIVSKLEHLVLFVIMHKSYLTYKMDAILEGRHTSSSFLIGLILRILHVQHDYIDY